MNNHKIAVIPGDGIGREVMPQVQRALYIGGSASTQETGRAIAEAI